MRPLKARHMNNLSSYPPPPLARSAQRWTIARRFVRLERLRYPTLCVSSLICVTRYLPHVNYQIWLADMVKRSCASHTLHLRPSTGHRRTGITCIWENTPRALSRSRACHRRWTGRLKRAGYRILRVFWNIRLENRNIFPSIIADNRLRRRYRSAKMEIPVSKFDAAFKGFGGSFERLLWAEITPRPFDCSPWMTKTGGEKFYYTGRHVSGILNRNFTRLLLDLPLLQSCVRWRKKNSWNTGEGRKYFIPWLYTYSKYAGNQYGINIYIYKYIESSGESIGLEKWNNEALVNFIEYKSYSYRITVSEN